MAITSDEENGITMVEAWIGASFTDGNRVEMEQVTRQICENDQIIEDLFCFNMSG